MTITVMTTTTIITTEPTTKKARSVCARKILHEDNASAVIDPDIEALVVECAEAVTANSANMDMKAAFKMADTNHNGHISIKEFAKLLKALSGRGRIQA